MFTRGLSYNASDFIYASKFYVRLQNWVVTSHHQYGIFALAPQTSFRGMETISGVAEVSFFSHATTDKIERALYQTSPQI